MGQKYFETKDGSLEAVSTKIAQEQPTIKKPEVDVKLERKTYFENKPGSLSDVAAKVVSEGFIKENTYAFDYNFELYMPAEKQRGDGDAIKEYEGTIKVSGKDAAEAKTKAEKELQRRIDAAEKSTRGTLEGDNLGPAKAVSEGMDPVNKDAVKKKFADRKDKDIDNDGDVDSSDKFLHKRRKAISKATSEAVTQDDHGEKINQDKKDAAMKKTDQKKDFKSLRAETKIIKLGDKGKTATGKTAGAIDVEPSAKPI